MVQTVRLLAILANLAVFGYVFVVVDVKDLSGDDWWAVFLTALLVITNLSAILLPQSSVKEENIFGLWLRVKKAELKRRLDES